VASGTALHPRPPAIDDGRVRLRPAHRDDQRAIVRWRNQDDVRKWFLNSQELRLEDAFQWHDAYERRNDDVLFIVEDLNDSGAAVGAVSLYNIDLHAGTAEVGRIMIGEPKARGKSLGLASLMLVVSFAQTL
jgi:RimJ/RimL family protein N-acetyltransferase